MRLGIILDDRDTLTFEVEVDVSTVEVNVTLDPYGNDLVFTVYDKDGVQIDTQKVRIKRDTQWSVMKRS